MVGRSAAADPDRAAAIAASCSRAASISARVTAPQPGVVGPSAGDGAPYRGSSLMTAILARPDAVREIRVHADQKPR